MLKIVVCFLGRLRIVSSFIWLGWLLLLSFSAAASDMQVLSLQQPALKFDQAIIGYHDPSSTVVDDDFTYGLEEITPVLRPNPTGYIDQKETDSHADSWWSSLSPVDFLIWVPLIALIVTNFVSIYNLREASKAAIKKELAVDSYKHIKNQLSEFYDPLNALVSTNYDMFQSLGPKTFPEDFYKGGEAAELWDDIVNEVILPNNESIVEIIKTKSYLIDPSDNLDNYFYYVKHAQSYMLFRKQANSLHGKFPYPKELLGSIVKVRSLVINKLKSKEKELSA